MLSLCFGTEISSVGLVAHMPDRWIFLVMTEPGSQRHTRYIVHDPWGFQE